MLAGSTFQVWTEISHLKPWDFIIFRVNRLDLKAENLDNDQALKHRSAKKLKAAKELKQCESELGDWSHYILGTAFNNISSYWSSRVDIWWEQNQVGALHQERFHAVEAWREGRVLDLQKVEIHSHFRGHR